MVKSLLYKPVWLFYFNCTCICHCFLIRFDKSHLHVSNEYRGEKYVKMLTYLLFIYAYPTVSIIVPSGILDGTFVKWIKYSLGN